MSGFEPGFVRALAPCFRLQAAGLNCEPRCSGGGSAPTVEEPRSAAVHPAPDSYETNTQRIRRPNTIRQDGNNQRPTASADDHVRWLLRAVRRVAHPASLGA